MLTPDRAHEIFARLRKLSSADEVELILSGGHSALTRFANNTIHQNVAEEGYVASVRTVLDGKTARATTSKFDDDSLRRAVLASEQLAKVQEKDPALLPMLKPQEATVDYAEVNRNFAETAKITPDDRAAAVGQIVAVAQKHKQTTAGIYASSHQTEALLNSNGVARFHEHTSAEISITMLGDDSSGWQKQNSPNVADLDAQALAEIAARKSRESAHPREVPAGKYTVILEPAAVLDLLGFMFFDFGGAALLEQRSFLNNRFGTKVFGDNVTIWDDVCHPLQSGAPFDGEGMSRQKVALVENGWVKNLVYSRATARQIPASEFAALLGEVRPTGHGFPLPNEIGDAPMNIVMAGAPPGQEKTVDEMVASTARGILVTRLWYIREVDPYEKILTGMTRDGTFLVEDGKVQGGVRNFRFNQSLVEMLNGVELLGRPVRSSGEESFDMVVPALKIKDFNFTEVTRF